MKDKELLELAAKAVGRTIHYNYLGSQDCNRAWYPLDDDGDALRLATQLEFNIYHAACSVFVEDLDQGIEVAVGHGDDNDAATRRAIVIAAAQIGETM